MVFLIIIVGVVGFFVGGTCAIAWTRDKKPYGVNTTSNHHAMARWIDQVVNDDMTRPLLGKERITSARKSLDDFYGED